MTLLLAVLTARADLQFDVFVGYGSGGGSDGIVREAGWFPVACEIFNDGPTFDAVFELSSQQLGGGQVRRLAIELPNNTRKRFSFPMFSGAGRYASWNAKLFDSRGKLRAERPDIRTRDLGWETFLLGGLARSFAGMPSFPQVKHNRPDQQPTVARLTVDQFPDNPIALEGLNALYLDSEKAVELKAPQAQAIVSWVMGGGHLVVAPSQIQDFASTRWLDALMPAEFVGMTTNRVQAGLQNWLLGGTELRADSPNLPQAPAANRPRNAAGAQPNPYSRLTADPAFDAAGFPVYEMRLREGARDLNLGSPLLAATGTRGRGQVTVLAFNPEREPFRSWQNKPWFWARLFGLPGDLFGETPRNVYGGWGLDSVFGAMIETRQVRKLPVEWLLLLLVVYLVVIGPFDRWFLRKINRQMLTWLTFPAYVLLFSLLIYYIGYRLRAGETEWNELHLVDLLPRGEQVVSRGRTFATLYSSSNARYRLASDQPFASLRGEFLGPSGGRQESSRVEATLKPNGFQADVSVPVWTSLLYVSDWQESGDAPFAAAVSAKGNQWVVTVQNRQPRVLYGVTLCIGDNLFRLGDVPASQQKVFTVNAAQAQRLPDFVRVQSQSFSTAASQRHQAFGGSKSGLIELTPEAVIAASLLGAANNTAANQRSFVYPNGTDLSPLLARGQALLFAWDAGGAPTKSPLARFKAPRVTQNTLFRLALPVSPES